MTKTSALILVGAIVGLVLGSSMGIAVGGTAYNAMYFLAPTGAFIGWLVSRDKDADGRTSDVGTFSSNSEFGLDEDSAPKSPDNKPDEKNFFMGLFWAAAALLATLWNFQIDLLERVGVLNSFVQRPLYFLALCICISLFFPPFIGLYILAWLGAHQFGISETSKYRADIN
ncbi:MULTISPECIES: hypothetical protein [Roseobacteraceae]|uniref:Uncharacterized protein n=1 Tax=Pseudosulfitobacter pseudonitzschiae TaxID=1402135 RepID=A0A221JWW0_9RHOB|nr:MULTISPECIES: hypothetical protein [Roseobacteraceae]ASM71218.1 hypothetical protein SULPSESMR1_00383 [Pseudosulfitobacter pseudonitzschiae]